MTGAPDNLRPPFTTEALVALYRLTHGSYKVGPGEYLHAGDAIELTAEVAKELGDAVLISVPDIPAPVDAAPTPIPPTYAVKAKKAKR